MLSGDERRKDPLIAAAQELNVLRSRSPAHGEELIAWTDRFMASTGLDETAEERRLRHAACLLADIGWRAHPDYRGEQSLNIIANAAFVGIDHPGRVYLALAVFFRHVGLVDEELSPRIRELASTRVLDRARVLGAALRVAYLVSASTTGVLPKTPMVVERGRVVLRFRNGLRDLAGERVFVRLAPARAPDRPRAGDGAGIGRGAHSAECDCVTSGARLSNSCIEVAMGADCCGSTPVFEGLSADYKRRLWAVIAINATMFFVEMGAGAFAGSQALQADALDFLGDTLTYGISLAVIGSAVARARLGGLRQGAEPHADGTVGAGRDRLPRARSRRAARGDHGRGRLPGARRQCRERAAAGEIQGRRRQRTVGVAVLAQ